MCSPRCKPGSRTKHFWRGARDSCLLTSINIPDGRLPDRTPTATATGHNMSILWTIIIGLLASALQNSLCQETTTQRAVWLHSYVHPGDRGCVRGHVSGTGARLI